MAGYIGSKSSVTLVDGYTEAEADAEFVNDPNSVITVSGSNVGIGTSSPVTALQVVGDITFGDGHSIGDDGGDNLKITSSAGESIVSQSDTGVHTWRDATDELGRFDGSGHLLVGTTDAIPSNNSAGTTADNGIALGADGLLEVAAYKSTANAGAVGYFNRTGTDGGIIDLRKDGTTVGSIGNRGASNLSISFGVSDSGYGITGSGTSTGALLPCDGTLDVRDNYIDFGGATGRWDDIYATNGTIQTSDRNEKQDIEALNEAETAVAVACKGLLRKFRWIDAVAEKGDDARIHFGIIAQDLQDAFAAQGLDAGRYAMFISGTWWEADRVIPAVEAVAEVTETTTDEDGNDVVTVITEAVEAVAEQTVTDTFEKIEEAPKGATERTRLGVRYPELLAFIIGAL